MGWGWPNALGTRALCARDSDVLGRLDFFRRLIHSADVEPARSVGSAAGQEAHAMTNTQITELATAIATAIVLL